MNNRPNLPQELAEEARHLLALALDMNMGTIAQELHDLTPALQALSSEQQEAPGQALEGIPEWAAQTFTSAALPDGAVQWGVVRAHLSSRLAMFLGNGLVPSQCSQALAEALSDGESQYEQAAVSPRALADALGLDLYDYAAEAWQGLNGPQAPTPEPLKEEARNV